VANGSMKKRGHAASAPTRLAIRVLPTERCGWLVLASMAGASREMSTRVFHVLAKQGEISCGGRALVPHGTPPQHIP
jgi:CRP-like cAMP-binding protein